MQFDYNHAFLESQPLYTRLVDKQTQTNIKLFLPMIATTSRLSFSASYAWNRFQWQI